MKITWTRRALLESGAMTLAALAAGCGDDADTAGGDTAGEAVALSKEVYVQIVGAGVARLRFETLEDRALSVVVIDPDGAETRVEPERASQVLDYEWDYISDNDQVEGEGDLPGEHVLHTVTISELVSGARYAWRVERGGGEVSEGSFRAPPAAGESFTLGWLADTMFANSTASVEGLAPRAPDIVVHGGDLVYQTHPYDTWVEFSRHMAAVTSQAMLMTTAGNHEFESMDEVEQMFDRLYEGQGDSGGKRYYAFTYGAMRFFVLDSESGREGYDADVADQLAWLEAELAAAAADPSIGLTAACMHRPMYTLSKYWQSDATDRDALHAIFAQYGVQLVFAGHMHGYERFLVDGVTYIVDGGGGGILYDPVEEAEAVEAARPGEGALQQAWHKSYGYTVLQVDGEGGWSLTRYDAEDGAAVDSASG
jgi:3',5'-cyclic AMP phosphodiesterase CpdA